MGPGPVEAAVMLLTHPERLQRYEDLCIDCSGAEYDYNADGSFDDAPFFRFYDVELHFYSRSVALYSDLIGPASAFLV